MRLDIQGVRGVAILMVVLGHLFQRPEGMFTALDMFFVLSGFLITGLLLDAHAREGRIHLAPFYLSRMRRLLPTAVLGITVTVLIHYLLFSDARGDQVREDGQWALLFASNWHFAQQEGDYFAAQAASPLVHFWSLSVEEQFYAVWPFILIVLLAVGRRLATDRIVLTVGLVVFTLSMFGYSMWHSTADPAVAYYSTLDRSWEFGVGGLLAVIRPLLARIPPRVGMTMTTMGFVGIFVPIFVLKQGIAFPAPWGLPVVVVVCFLLAGGVNPETRDLPVITNPALVYAGNISYSLYICHLPVNMISEEFISRGATYYAVTLFITATLSALCYHFVERPMRYAPWLMIESERERFGDASWNSRGRRGAGLLVSSTATVSLLCGIAVMTTPATAGERAFPVAADLDADSPASLLDQQKQRLSQALGQDPFPAFDPPLERLGWERLVENLDRTYCTNVNSELVAECHFGSERAERQVVVVGDSYAMAWMPAIVSALDTQHWSVQQLTLRACPTWTLPSYISSDGKPYPDCAKHHQLVRDYISSQRPDLVILMSGQGHVRNGQRSDIDEAPIILAEQALGETLDLLQPLTERLVVISPNPRSGNLVDCVTRLNEPHDCTISTDPEWVDMTSGEAAAAATRGVTYINTGQWFCLGGRCPAFVGRTPVTVDGSHLTMQFAATLAPLLREALGIDSLMG
ncbi:acyltransferase family protein [Nocardioides dilutus]